MRGMLTSFQSNKKAALRRWQNISSEGWHKLKSLTTEHQLSISSGDITLLDGRWYVTHSGLLALATFHRKNALSDIGRVTSFAADMVLSGDFALVCSRARVELTVPA